MLLARQTDRPTLLNALLWGGYYRALPLWGWEVSAFIGLGETCFRNHWGKGEALAWKPTQMKHSFARKPFHL